MVPLLMVLYARYHNLSDSTLMTTSIADVERHLTFFDGELAGRSFLVGDDLTGADIQMTFVGEAANAISSLDAFSNIRTYVNSMHARPAYRRSLEIGGPYEYERQFPKGE